MRRNKYNNIPTIVDGVRFDSKGEAARWGELKLLESAGQIKDLQRQVECPLEVNGELVCVFRADYEYYEKTPIGKWKLVVEDFKGYQSPASKIKHKLFKAVYGFGIRITQAYKRKKRQRESKRQSVPPSAEG